MADIMPEPKRRGRPPKVPMDPRAWLVGPTTRLRLKAGRIQQAWQHHNGTQWRDLPAVADDAPDWEGGE